MDTKAKIADEIIDNWLEHFLDAHPEVIIQAISDGTIRKHSCAACNSLHAQLDSIE